MQSKFCFSLIIDLIFVFWAGGVSASSLFDGKTRVLVVREEHESEMDVHDDDDWGDHEENLKRATWKGWALVEVGFAVLLLVLIGFGAVESFLLFGAAINIHHFIVDAFIWKLRKGTDNRRIVDKGALVTA